MTEVTILPPAAVEVVQPPPVLIEVTMGVGSPGPPGPPGADGVTDHGALTGLTDDDHTQYLNNSRGDARYSALGHLHTGTYWGLWTGTQAAYDAIVTKDPNVLYVVV